MLEILHRIEAAVEEFPGDGKVCSASVDPNPLKSFILDVRRGMELCRVCLACYDDPANFTPHDPWIEAYGQKLHRSRPWNEYSAEVWLARRDRALRLLIRAYGVLRVEYEDVETGKDLRGLGGVNRRFKFRPADMLYALQGHMLLCAYALFNEADRKAVGSCAAHEGNPFVAKQELSLSATPIGLYSTGQLQEALEWLSAKMNTLQYDENLCIYMLQLEMRGARILFYPDSSLVHDVPDYRDAVEEGALGAGLDTIYKASDRLLSTLASGSVAIHSCIMTAKLLPRVMPSSRPELFVVHPEVSQALRKWFVHQATRSVTRVPSDWLKKVYLEASLWPGEREFYRLRNPKDSTANTLTILAKHRDPNSPAFIADRAIIKARRGVQYADLIEDAERSPPDIIEKDLSAVPGSTESMLLQLALVEFMSLATNKMWMGTDWSVYCTLSCDYEIQLEAIVKEPHVPRVVQVFNHFQLAWEREVVFFDSFIESLCAWFYLMTKRRRAPEWSEENRVYLRPFHLSARISIEDTVREIFGRVPYCRQHWWKPGTVFEDERQDSMEYLSVPAAAASGTARQPPQLPRAPPSLYEF